MWNVGSALPNAPAVGALFKDTASRAMWCREPPDSRHDWTPWRPLEVLGFQWECAEIYCLAAPKTNLACKFLLVKAATFPSGVACLLPSLLTGPRLRGSVCKPRETQRGKPGIWGRNFTKNVVILHVSTVPPLLLRKAQLSLWNAIDLSLLSAFLTKVFNW